MEIRILTAGDADAFWHLRLEALESQPQAFGQSAEEHRALSLESFVARFNGTHDNFAVGAFLDGRLVGTVGFFRNQGLKEKHKGRVWGMYVTASQRGQGVGRALLTALLDQAHTLPDIEQVILTVATTQLAAKQLYTSLGFEKFGHEPNALRVGEQSVDEDYMILRLPANDRAESRISEPPRS